MTIVGHTKSWLKKFRVIVFVLLKFWKKYKFLPKSISIHGKFHYLDSGIPPMRNFLSDQKWVICHSFLIRFVRTLSDRKLLLVCHVFGSSGLVNLDTNCSLDSWILWYGSLGKRTCWGASQQGLRTDHRKSDQETKIIIKLVQLVVKPKTQYCITRAGFWSTGESVQRLLTTKSRSDRQKDQCE